MKKKQESKAPAWTCDHCRKNFLRESTMARHLCESKRRWDERDRPSNRIGFLAWQLFYSQYQPHRSEKTYRDFVTSNYWIGFVKWGIYCVDADVLMPLAFARWLLKAKISLDNWTSDTIYGQYLIEYLLNEDPIDAIHRGVRTMADIADDQNIRIGDVLRLYNTNRLCYLITKGKISPWLLYTTDSGLQFLGKLNEDQQRVIMDYINPDAWAIKIHKNSERVEEIKKILGEGGL